MASIVILISPAARGRFDARLPDSAQFLIEGSRKTLRRPAQSFLPPV
jgi:hypothetical protein